MPETETISPTRPVTTSKSVRVTFGFVIGRAHPRSARRTPIGMQAHISWTIRRNPGESASGGGGGSQSSSLWEGGAISGSPLTTEDYACRSSSLRPDCKRTRPYPPTTPPKGSMDHSFYLGPDTLHSLTKRAKRRGMTPSSRWSCCWSQMPRLSSRLTRVVRTRTDLLTKGTDEVRGDPRNPRHPGRPEGDAARTSEDHRVVFSRGSVAFGGNHRQKGKTRLLKALTIRALVSSICLSSLKHILQHSSASPVLRDPRAGSGGPLPRPAAARSKPLSEPLRGGLCTPTRCGFHGRLSGSR